MSVVFPSSILAYQLRHIIFTKVHLKIHIFVARTSFYFAHFLWQYWSYSSFSRALSNKSMFATPLHIPVVCVLYILSQVNGTYSSIPIQAVNERGITRQGYQLLVFHRLASYKWHYENLLIIIWLYVIIMIIFHYNTYI